MNREYNQVGELQIRLDRSDFATRGHEWQTIDEIRFKVIPKSGNEPIEGDRKTTVMHYTVITPWRKDGITTKQRIQQPHRTFEIQAVVNVDERQRQYRLLCTAER